MPEEPKIHVSRHLTRLTMEAQKPAIIKALLSVFERYQVELLDQEVLIHFALRQLDVTLDTYFLVAGAMRQVLNDCPRFGFSQGAPREPYEALGVRRILIHLQEPEPTQPPPEKKLGPRKRR